ncbi:nucleoside triphosphate pyrophosphohydrolase [Alteromonadaceae bacterium M269]|nr:nucleoside triphosphate pyrophosphohydrolase [Alteromonadaceae bacterium M269]
MTKVVDSTNPQLERLLWVMDKLRDPEGGCPWDLEQDFASIVPHTLEEAYEVADAIENGSMDDVKSELGDLLFQVVFYARLAKEEQLFDFEGIAESIAEKLIRRHPHVFGSESEKSADKSDLNAQWETIKQQERKAAGKVNDNSILANIPKGMAPLTKAFKLQKKCAKVGFDWPELPPVVDKIHEEIEEVLAELNAESIDQVAVEDEVGDLLFAVVNLARHAKVDPERALRKANHKFETRFRQVEQQLSLDFGAVENCSLEQMENAWQRIKQIEKE